MLQRRLVHSIWDSDALQIVVLGSCKFDLTAASTRISRSCPFLSKGPNDNSNGTLRLGTHKITLYAGIADLVVPEWQQVTITSRNK